MRHPKFEILVGKDNKFEFRLKALNGEPVLFGPGFCSKSEVVHAISNVMYHGISNARYVQKETADGRFYYQLKSPIGRLLGWSEYFHSRQTMLSGIRAARAAAKSAQVIDFAIASK